MIGDAFVRKSARQVFLHMNPCLTTSWFDVHINTAPLDSKNPYILSRVCNALTEGLNRCINMPKLVVFIPEADFIDDLNQPDKKTR